MVPPEPDPTCQAARVWISAAVDGEAGDLERAAVRGHLATCQACREWAALAESLVLRVRTAEPARPSRSLLVPPPAVAPRPRRRRRARAAVAVALGAAAIAAGVLVGTVGGGGGVTPPSTPPGRVIVAINDAAHVVPPAVQAAVANGSSDRGGSRFVTP
jgi:predicted anti-sigma-YlaC factor YlaD